MNKIIKHPFIVYILTFLLSSSLSLFLILSSLPLVICVFVLIGINGLVFFYVLPLAAAGTSHKKGSDDVQRAKDRVSTAVIGLLHSTTDISSLKTYNDLIRQNLDNRVKLEEFLRRERQIIDEYSEKTKSLVSDLSQSFQTGRIRTDMNRLICQSVEFIRLKRIRFKTIPVKLTGPDREVYAAIHPSQIKTAIESIIENSYDELLEADSDQSYIAISVLTKDNHVEIVIKDNGRGMAGITGEVPNSFVSPGKTGKANGNGLGLYVAIRSIEDNGGSILMKSSQEGLETTITFPES